MKRPFIEQSSSTIWLLIALILVVLLLLIPTVIQAFTDLRPEEPSESRFLAWVLVILSSLTLIALLALEFLFVYELAQRT